MKYKSASWLIQECIFSLRLGLTAILHWIKNIYIYIPWESSIQLKWPKFFKVSKCIFRCFWTKSDVEFESVKSFHMFYLKSFHFRLFDPLFFDQVVHFFFLLNAHLGSVKSSRDIYSYILLVNSCQSLFNISRYFQITILFTCKLGVEIALQI